MRLLVAQTPLFAPLSFLQTSAFTYIRPRARCRCSLSLSSPPLFSLLLFPLNKHRSPPLTSNLTTNHYRHRPRHSHSQVSHPQDESVNKTSSSPSPTRQWQRLIPTPTLPEAPHPQPQPQPPPQPRPFLQLHHPPPLSRRAAPTANPAMAAPSANAVTFAVTSAVLPAPIALLPSEPAHFRRRTSQRSIIFTSTNINTKIIINHSNIISSISKLTNRPTSGRDRSVGNTKNKPSSSLTVPPTPWPAAVVAAPPPP